jgi:Zn-finger nucleic acid-binding protein
MKCPKCSQTLLMSERQGVEIDYCPDCRGVWLDRGELDKIVQRSGEAETERAPSGPSRDYAEQRGGYGEHRKEDAQRHRPKRRGSFLSELFDFGD